MEALHIPVKLYIHSAVSKFASEKYVVTACDMSLTFPDQYVLLETRDITLEIEQPDAFDVIAKQITNLRTLQDQISADSELKLAEIEDRIQQLLCIKHSPVFDPEIPF